MEMYNAEVKPIKRFRGEYRFLSNFWDAEVTHRGRTFPTVEHAYQAAKTHDPQMRMVIQDASNPGLAKKMGSDAILRPDWEDIKVGVMGELLEKKFSIPELERKLVETYPAQLIEGNYWGDDFWGVTDNGDGKGKNQLGKLLMKIRLKKVEDQ